MQCTIREGLIALRRESGNADAVAGVLALGAHSLTENNALKIKALLETSRGWPAMTGWEGGAGHDELGEGAG